MNILSKYILTIFNFCTTLKYTCFLKMYTIFNTFLYRMYHCKKCIVRYWYTPTSRCIVVE